MATMPPLPLCPCCVCYLLAASPPSPSPWFEGGCFTAADKGDVSLFSLFVCTSSSFLPFLFFYAAECLLISISVWAPLHLAATRPIVLEMRFCLSSVLNGFRSLFEHNVISRLIAPLDSCKEMLPRLEKIHKCARCWKKKRGGEIPILKMFSFYKNVLAAAIQYEGGPFYSCPLVLENMFFLRYWERAKNMLSNWNVNYLRSMFIQALINIMYFVCIWSQGDCLFFYCVREMMYFFSLCSFNSFAVFLLLSGFLLRNKNTLIINIIVFPFFFCSAAAYMKCIYSPRWGLRLCMFPHHTVV